MWRGKDAHLPVALTALNPIDQVLQKTAQLLNRPGASSVSDQQVLCELGWPAEREAEVRRLMAHLIEEGDLRGPRSGPLRGDNQILAVDVMSVTAQGEQRLAHARRPWWRRAWQWGGRLVGGEVWKIDAAVIAAVLGLALYTAAHLRGLLP